MRSNKSERWTDNTMANEEHLSLYCLSISPIYCSSFAIVLSVHLSHLLLLICHCIAYLSLIYCSSFVIILFVHLSELLLLICHCIVCLSLLFTAPHLSLYCLSISLMYCSSFVIVSSVHLSDLVLLICHCIVCPL